MSKSILTNRNLVLFRDWNWYSNKKTNISYLQKKDKLRIFQEIFLICFNIHSHIKLTKD